MTKLAFLFGLLVMPTLLLWLGHRLRDRTPAQRGAFWGGVTGHTAALLLAVLLLHYPPVLWTDGIRSVVVMWGMLLGGAAGAAIGALRAGRAHASD